MNRVQGRNPSEAAPTRSKSGIAGGDDVHDGIIEEDEEVTDMGQHGDGERAVGEGEAARDRIADLADGQARPVA